MNTDDLIDPEISQLVTEIHELVKMQNSESVKSIEPKLNPVQSNTVQLNTAQLNTTQLNTAQKNTSQLNPAHLNPAQKIASAELTPNPQFLENIAQKIFDQDVHDLAFEEEVENRDVTAASSSDQEKFQGAEKMDMKSFVEVSHFHIFAPSGTEMNKSEAPRSEVEEQNTACEATSVGNLVDQGEDSVLEQNLSLQVSESLGMLTSSSSAPLIQSLCDDELIKEIQSIPKRLSFKIGDVAELLQVKPFVLRYWETEFDVLKPKKALNKQRMYARKEVENAFLIRKLLHRDRFSIEGARNALKAARQSLKQRLEDEQASQQRVPQSPPVVRAESPVLPDVHFSHSEESPLAENRIQQETIPALAELKAISDLNQTAEKEKIMANLKSLRERLGKVQEMTLQLKSLLTGI